MPARGAAFGLLELAEDAGLRVGRDADAGVAHPERHVVRSGARLRQHPDAAGWREFHRIAGEIEQHLPQPHRIADHFGSQARIREGGDLEAFCLRARRQQLDHLFDQRVEPEGFRLEVEPAGLDLREIEHVADQRHQRVAGAFHRARIGRLLGGQRRVEQEVRHAQNAVERRADLVADHGEEAALGAIGRIGLVARLGERAPGGGAVGDVAADALRLGAVSLIGAHRHVAPGNPARAVRRLDLLVMDARAVGENRDRALLQQRQRHVCADQGIAAASGERAEGVVHIGDAAGGVAPHDDVPLRLQKTLGVLLGLLDLPFAIGDLL